MNLTNKMKNFIFNKKSIVVLIFFCVSLLFIKFLLNIKNDRNYPYFSTNIIFEKLIESKNENILFFQNIDPKFQQLSERLEEAQSFMNLGRGRLLIPYFYPEFKGTIGVLKNHKNNGIMQFRSYDRDKSNINQYFAKLNVHILDVTDFMSYGEYNSYEYWAYSEKYKNWYLLEAIHYGAVEARFSAAESASLIDLIDESIKNNAEVKVIE